MPPTVSAADWGTGDVVSLLPPYGRAVNTVMCFALIGIPVPSTISMAESSLLKVAATSVACHMTYIWWWVRLIANSEPLTCPHCREQEYI